jgi:hypothetical protein
MDCDELKDRVELKRERRPAARLVSEAFVTFTVAVKPDVAETMGVAEISVTVSSLEMDSSA